MNAKAAHIGRIIVSLWGSRLNCQLVPRLKVPAKESEMTKAARHTYRLAPRYVVHTALAKVWDAFRAHAFSTSATIDDMLILGCVWSLAAAT